MEFLKLLCLLKETGMGVFILKQNVVKILRRRRTAVKLAQLGGEELLRGTSCNVINLKRLLNGKQNVWKYQNGEEKSDSDGREKDV